LIYHQPSKVDHLAPLLPPSLEMWVSGPALLGKELGLVYPIIASLSPPGKKMGAASGDRHRRAKPQFLVCEPRRVSTEHDAQITLIASVDPTDARNFKRGIGLSL
jgi:hypothetical protein